MAWICDRYRARHAAPHSRACFTTSSTVCTCPITSKAEGPVVFRHACMLGVEGIVSKRKDSPYRSGRTADWIKVKNPASPPAKREFEEDWGR
jgi:ATP-dependent DNA ligase